MNWTKETWKLKEMFWFNQLLILLFLDSVQTAKISFKSLSFLSMCRSVCHEFWGKKKEKTMLKSQMSQRTRTHQRPICQEHWNTSINMFGIVSFFKRLWVPSYGKLKTKSGWAIFCPYFNLIFFLRLYFLFPLLKGEHALGAKCSENGWEITRRKLHQKPPKFVRWVALGILSIKYQPY